MRIEKRKISELNPAPYNPRLSTEEQEQHLKESLSKFGVVEPIIVNDITGNIVGGHFRTRELEKLGYDEVDCVIVSLSLEDEKELNIRLNANTGSWDWATLKLDWDYDDLTDWGLEFPDDFFNEDEDLKDDEDDSLNLETYFKIEIEVDTEIEQEELFNELQDRGFKCKLLTL